MSMNRKLAPEGEWGWMVVLASFVFHFFSLGTIKALGVFVPQLGAAFDISDGEVGIVCGIAFGLKAILGPVWATAALKWNAREITAIGGFLTAIGFIGAGWAVSTLQLAFCLALTGIGFGLPSVALLVIIRDYFDIRFSLATGIAYTGSAIGMIVLPSFVEILITSYGWRSAIILLGALCFNICAVRNIRST
ncbi:monocarboxylate transporter 11-like [Amphiura filiformis]|uniref:monocarboxylate transporter 11-like n=1 Tax=Amphiura filiformis TaxID=82378 RepID=UPI003B2211C7